MILSYFYVFCGKFLSSITKIKITIKVNVIFIFQASQLYKKSCLKKERSSVPKILRHFSVGLGMVKRVYLSQNDFSIEYCMIIGCLV